VVFYSYSFTVPASTSEDSPVSQELKITAGIVTRLDVLFPAGCSALVRAAVFWREDQIIPRAPSDWLRGHNERVETKPMLEIPASHSILQARGWSADDTYSHTLEIRIEVMPRGLAFPNLVFRELQESLETGLGKLNDSIERLHAEMRAFNDLWGVAQATKKTNLVSETETESEE